MGDTSDENQETITLEAHASSDESNIHSRLCTQKPIRIHSTCPVRKVSQNIQYHDKYSDKDLPPTSTRPKRYVKPSSGPSQECIAARGKKTVQPLHTHPLILKKPVKAETIPETPQVDAQDEAKVTPASDFSDEDNLPLSSFRENTSDTKTVPKKCVLVTRKIGLVKRKLKHTCKCPICLRSYPTQGELNRHYR